MASIEQIVTDVLRELNDANRRSILTLIPPGSEQRTMLSQNQLRMQSFAFALLVEGIKVDFDSIVEHQYKPGGEQ